MLVESEHIVEEGSIDIIVLVEFAGQIFEIIGQISNKKSQKILIVSSIYRSSTILKTKTKKERW